MYIKYIHMYITVHQVQLPERGVRAALKNVGSGALVQQTQYSSVHQYSSTARALQQPCDHAPADIHQIRGCGIKNCIKMNVLDVQ